MALAPPHAIPLEPGSVDTISTALLSNGNIVVILGFTGDVQAKALVLDADGNTIVAAFAAHEGSVAALHDGGFDAAWTDPDPATGDGSGSAIKGQAFSNDGAPLGAEMLVNATASGDHDRIWTGRGIDLIVFNEGDGRD
jgi:hypothetical protein